MIGAGGGDYKRQFTVTHVAKLLNRKTRPY